MLMTASTIGALTAQDGGLTLHDFLVDIPHDPAAFVVYALTFVAIIWVVRAGLGKSGSDGTGSR